MPIHPRLPRTISLACALALTLSIAPHAFADDSGDAAPPARFTGPLVSGAPSLPQGLFNIEPYLIYNHVDAYYDANGDRHSLAESSAGWHLAVPMLYGITDRLTIGAVLNAFHGDNAFGDGTTRMGDASVSVMYKFLQGQGAARPSLTAVFRQNLPIGKHDQMDLEPHDLTTGSGAATTTVGLHGQVYSTLGGRTLRSRANLKYTLPYDGATVHGESVYATFAGFEGVADLQGGWQATTGFEYALDSRWVLAIDGVYERDFGVAIGDADGRFVSKSPHAWRFSVAPAVEYHFNDNVGVIAGVFASLAGRNSSAVLAPQVAVNVAF
ncbi:hypothetical protein LYSHEL_25240 [Lysobacter helvus]|uniref:Transporter n=2 Tax=Lysobacteraceae TaxID=32033 RepID=A0ABM7Q819_9GAMM|nr:MULTISPECIES: hypothetical protein [Lysobacter]BCT93500.1 hypothetical protein LYSCAS_25240 [Lysobacter caseinilyticus]BCT96653.1 hypothetical protein LYSHEL_25240 [Lysobacter helvus]